MTTIHFTSEYFSGSQKFLCDKKAEKFLKMLKKNHDLLNKPRIVSNNSIKALNEKLLSGFRIPPNSLQTLTKEVLISLKIEISHDRN